MSHLLVAALAVLCCFSCSDKTEEALTVYAASSLEEALTEAAREWTNGSGVRVRFNFAGSNELARQLLAGASADVFFSANEEEMSRVRAAEIVEPDSIASFLSNRMVLVAAPGATVNLEGESRLAIGDESVPVGHYAREWLKVRKRWERLNQPGQVIVAVNARATLGAVESGVADIGCVYHSDAVRSDAVIILEDQGPNEPPTITYPVAVLRGARRKNAAASFALYLESQAELFERFGFRVRD